MAATTGFRGEGTREGDDIANSLLATAASRIERARVELNNGSAVDDVDLEARYQASIRPGQLINVVDSGQVVAYTGRVTEFVHSDVAGAEGAGARTDISLERSAV